MERNPTKPHTTIRGISTESFAESREALRQVSFKKKVLVVLMCVQTFVTFLMIALISPFYPDVASGKGASVTEINLVFSILFITAFCVSPIFGSYITILGPKFLYITGIYVRIVAEMCFGILIFAPDGAAFIALSFITRIFSAIGDASFSTSSYAIVAKEFPDSVTAMFGLLQTMTACGLMMGPPVGGVLYDLGKGTRMGAYTFPFVCMTILGIVITTINAFYMPPSHDDGPTKTHAADSDTEKDVNKPKRAGMGTLLRNPSVLLNLVVIIISSGPILHTEISLQPHLDQFGLSTALVGLMFTCETAVYAIFASLWGWIDDRWFHPRLQTLCGAIIYSVGCLLIGPTPLFNTNAQLWLVGISLCLIGIGGSALNTACFKGTLMQAFGMGMANDFDTSGLVSGLYMGAFQLGAFLGPTVGGVIVDSYDTEGFAWSMTLYGFILIGIVILFGTIMIVAHLLKRRRLLNEEKLPLLGKEPEDTTQSSLEQTRSYRC